MFFVRKARTVYSVGEKPDNPISSVNKRHFFHATEYSIHVFGAIELLIAERTGVISNPIDDLGKCNQLGPPREKAA